MSSAGAVTTAGTGPVKPRLRGTLHQGAAVVSLATGAVLISLAPTGRAQVAAAVYAASATLLFATSALYHRRDWSPRARPRIRRLDHSMSLVLIAGTYTPMALLVVPGSSGLVLLVTVWTGALIGIALRMLWLGAPRWATITPYLLLGWTAVLFLPDLLAEGGVLTVALLLAGGGLYSFGAIVYAARRPDPCPAVFGFHEVFHLLTILAGTVFYVAVSFAVYGA